MVEAEVRQLAQPDERLAEPLVEVVFEVGPGADGLLDLVVVPAGRGAVPAQDVELVPDVVAELAAWRVEQVAGVRVPRDEPQRLALAAAGDEDRGRGRWTELGELSGRTSW